MVEPGKRWNVVSYYTHGGAFWPEKEDDAKFMYYEIGEPLEIDNKIYCPIYCCPDIKKEGIEDNILIGYMREDYDLRQVWLKPVNIEQWERKFVISLYHLWFYKNYKEIPDEILLYDFKEKEDWSFSQDKYYSLPRISTQYEFKDGVHNGFKMVADRLRDYGIEFYEGIGAIESPERWDCLWNHAFSDPFGYHCSEIIGGQYRVLLCSVIAPDGSTILDIKMHDDILQWHDMLGIAESVNGMETKVWVEDNILKITSPSAIGNISITDMTGRTAIATHSDKNEATIPLNNLSKGIYVVNTPAVTRKIAVR